MKRQLDEPRSLLPVFWAIQEEEVRRVGNSQRFRYRCIHEFSRERVQVLRSGPMIALATNDQDGHTNIFGVPELLALRHEVVFEPERTRNANRRRRACGRVRVGGQAHPDIGIGDAEIAPCRFVRPGDRPVPAGQQPGGVGETAGPSVWVECPWVLRVFKALRQWPRCVHTLTCNSSGGLSPPQ